ncbi:MAG: hypothetical protein RL653_2818, partial [Pseudomonadota bacterium]
DVASDFAPGVLHAIQRALRTEPGLRFNSCEEFISGLRAAGPGPVSRDIPVPTRAPSSSAASRAPSLQSTLRPGTAKWPWAVAGLVSCAGLLALGLARAGDSQPRVGGAASAQGSAGRASTGWARLDKTEVTVEDYTECVLQGGCTVPRSGDRCNYGQPGKDKHPINCVDWFQANTFCQLQGKRLPTAAEWEDAASNGGTTLYPWGNDTPTADHARWAARGSRGGTAEVGSYPDGATKAGLQDMAGNVFEWVESDGNGVREVRGGSWFTGNPSMLLATYRLVLSMYQRETTYGFRCAR